MQALISVVLLVLLQQNIRLSDAVSCTSNPCNLVPGTYDASNGYCCYDVPPSDSVCTCPNGVASVLNGPCRTTTTTNQFSCNRTCVNGGVCNIVNGSEVCWCTLGFSGSFCELQGTSGRCASVVCQSGTCFENTIGASTYAYCQCNPGWTGARCEQCYFTCSAVGVFPDTAFCAVGRYFYCPQASGAPISAFCPSGMKFNRATNNCDANGSC